MRLTFPYPKPGIRPAAPLQGEYAVAMYRGRRIARWVPSYGFDKDEASLNAQAYIALPGERARAISPADARRMGWVQ